MSNFRNHTIESDAEEFLNKLNKNSLLIYSETSLKKINFCNDNVKRLNWHKISKNINNIKNVIDDNKNINQVVSFGGGSTIDIAKYIAYKLGIKYICIPSMLSTNSYATDKVALIKEEQKVTLNAKLPDCVILDCNLLKKSVTENMYGLADVLSIYIALYDWKIASEDIGEKIEEKIFSMALDLFYRVKSFISSNTLEFISDNVKQIFEYIGMSGHITNLYGTGRPESGSEHIFAKKIESIVNVPHGIAVSLGIILMSIMQEREVDEIIDIIKKIKVLDRCEEYGINRSIIEKSLLTLMPRKERYTIVNKFYNNNEYKIEKLQLFYQKINIKDEKYDFN